MENPLYSTVTHKEEWDTYAGAHASELPEGVVEFPTHERNERTASRRQRIGAMVLRAGRERVERLREKYLPPLPAERMREIEDVHTYPGEATGFERNVRLLGREFIGQSPPVVVTSPLGVKFPGYVREHIATVTPEIEKPMLVIDSVGFGKRQRYSAQERRQFHMSWMATDIHSILNQVEADTRGSSLWPRITFDTFDCSGASQGAMVGMEVAAQSRYFDREVDTCAFIAPAGLEDALGLRPRQLRSLGEITRQFGYEELRGLGRHLLRCGSQERQRVITRYLPTIPMPSTAIVPVITTALEILDGPMRGIGRSIRDQELNTRFDILLFEGDRVSTPDAWERELEGVANTTITKRSGRHIEGIIHPDTDTFVIGSLSRKARSIGT